MTIRPRHYAKLIIDGDDKKVVNRLYILNELTKIKRHLTFISISKLKPNFSYDQIIYKLILTLHRERKLKWLPAIVRTAEKLLKNIGRPTIAHVRIAHTETITEDEIKKSLSPTLSIGLVDLINDETQLGGIDIQLADERLDARISGRIERLRTVLKN